MLLGAGFLGPGVRTGQLGNYKICKNRNEHIDASFVDIAATMWVVLYISVPF